jgi:hypothetical protein
MGDASAYESLGLDPGADQAAVERAYKRLIKEHHPDRDGGDSGRAAEINRAYRELREGGSAGRDALELNEDDPWAGNRRFGLIGPALIAAGGLGALLLMIAPMNSALPDLTPASARPLAAQHQRGAPTDTMDLPLQSAAIDGAVRDARHIARTRDEMELATQSGDCHRRLKNRPELVQFDRCVAFDDAVVVLQDRDPLRDRGPFSELAVTGRQWSGASALSSDSLAIDGRLDRIRLRVEMALADAVPAIAD